MDKETLLSKFKPSIGEPDANTQMYGDTGLSVRTLDTYLEAILPGITDDAIVTDDYVNTHVKILKSMGGQMRHEQSEFVKKLQATDSTIIATTRWSVGRIEKKR